VRLGRHEEAKQLIDEVFKAANELKGSVLQLVPELNLIKAESSFIQGDLAGAAISAARNRPDGTAYIRCFDREQIFSWFGESSDGRSKEC
jgi:hypothetical protein